MSEIVKKNPLNDAPSKPVKTHSKFNPNYSRYDTHRFGLNTPHFVASAVADDDISVRCVADVDTFTLKAPAMQPIRRNMDYFQVNVRAMLPNTGELLITNPRTGDDVVAKDVNAIINAEKLAIKLNTMGNRLITGTSVTITSTTQFIAETFHKVLVLYQCYRNLLGSGALPKYLGYSFNKHFRFDVAYTDADGKHHNEYWSFDKYFETLFRGIDIMLQERPYSL